jgi:hypothetical protein
MQYAYHPSFLHATRRLAPHQARALLTAIEKFQRAIEITQWPHGLGITHLRDQYFEFRVDRHTRVVYRRSPGLIQYLLYGSHDDLRRFLKSL